MLCASALVFVMHKCVIYYYNLLILCGHGRKCVPFIKQKL